MNTIVPCPHQGCRGGKVHCLVGFDIFWNDCPMCDGSDLSEDMFLILSWYPTVNDVKWDMQETGASTVSDWPLSRSDSSYC